MSKKNNTVNNEIKNENVKEKKKATPWKIATATLAAARLYSHRPATPGRIEPAVSAGAWPRSAPRCDDARDH